MNRFILAIATAAVAVIGVVVEPSRAQQALSPELGWAAEMAGLNSSYRVTPNITYLTASNTALKDGCAPRCSNISTKRRLNFTRAPSGNIE